MSKINYTAFAKGINLNADIDKVPAKFYEVDKEEINTNGKSAIINISPSDIPQPAGEVYKPERHND